MPSDNRSNTPEEETQTQLAAALVKSLDRSLQEIPVSTQAALATARARALRKQHNHWPWAAAASVLVLVGAMAWQFQPPQDSDAVAFELLQTDDQLLNELEFLETLAEVDET